MSNLPSSLWNPDDPKPEPESNQERCHHCGEYYWSMPDGLMHTKYCETEYMKYLNAPEIGDE